MYEYLRANDARSRIKVRYIAAPGVEQRAEIALRERMVKLNTPVIAAFGDVIVLSEDCGSLHIYRGIFPSIEAGDEGANKA
mgnify:CR=1 FL=1